MHHPDDGPSIGIILCKAKNRVVVESALRDLAKPVGISSYVKDEGVILHDGGEQFRRRSGPRLGPDPTVMSQRAIRTISATVR